MRMRATTVFPFFTNLPSDVITNTIYWSRDGTNSFSADATVRAAQMETFWESIYTVNANWKAQYVNWANCSMLFYDMEEPEPRVPIIFPLDLSAGTEGTLALPTEVSIVLSFEASRAPGVPQARRRGRIYLGGWSNNVLSAGSVSSFPTVNTAVSDQIAAAAEGLANLTVGTEGWMVASTIETAEPKVVQGWVDNTPDTQRRRSVLATSRKLWSV